MKEAREGDLRIWWIPQVPMKAFYVPVKNLEQAVLINNTLAYYDLFQFENKIKPDYANVGGLQIFENGEWVDWYDEDACQDFDEYLKNI